MNVNCHDREIAGSDDNPTPGIILCTDKNDAVVRYALDKSQEKIFASRYRMALPSEKTLLAEVQREISALGLDQDSVTAKSAYKPRKGR